MNAYNSLKGPYGEYAKILEALIDNMPIPCSVVDTTEKFTLINKSYEKMFNISRRELLGRHYSVHVLPDEKSVHKSVLQEKRPCSSIKKMGTKEKLVQADGYPVIINGELICSIAILHEFSSVTRTMTAFDSARDVIRNANLSYAEYRFNDIIYQSAGMRSLVQKAKNAANSNIAVLLYGESGVGKEIFAHAIQAASARSKKNFVRINCAAIPESLLESVLFGYADGAFTGAKRGGEMGLFEAAEGGTIFLDEIGDIGLGLQAKLLRILHEKEFSRIGEIKLRHADVRVIAATNANLEEKVNNASFRSDLYYRLNIYPITIPALRDRKEDIPLLAKHFIARYSLEYNRNIEGITEEGLQKLLAHPWPGNIRELENTIARAVIDSAGNQTELRAENISFLMDINKPVIYGSGSLIEETDKFLSAFGDKDRSYKELFAEWEKVMLKSVWNQEKRNKSKTARRLGISVRSLFQKLKDYGIDEVPHT